MRGGRHREADLRGAADALMRPTFADRATQQEFARTGFVVRRVLDSDGVAQVAAMYDKLGCDLTEGWHADLFSADLEYRRRVHEEVGPIFSRVVLPWLDRHRHVSSIFVVKEPGTTDASRVPMHQDWTIVDPARYASLNMVCPFVDMTAENGWLVVVPGSHRPPTRISFGPHDELRFEGDWGEMTPYLQPLALRAGEAVLYDGRLLHGSPPNRSDRRRVAMSAGFIPAEASLRLHYRNKDRLDELEVLDLSDDFFLTHTLGTRPTGAVSQGFIPLVNRTITEAEVSAWADAVSGESAGA